MYDLRNLFENWIIRQFLIVHMRFLRCQYDTVRITVVITECDTWNVSRIRLKCACQRIDLKY